MISPIAIFSRRFKEPKCDKSPESKQTIECSECQDGPVESPAIKNAEDTLTLSDTKVGKIYKLVGFEACQELKEKIYSMGLNSGARLKIIGNSGHGPVGLEVRQTRLGIGRGMSRKILVKEIDPR